MTELLAVLTAIYKAYAVYEVFATVSEPGDGLNRAFADIPVAPQLRPPQQPAAPAVAMPQSAAVKATPTKQAASATEHDKHTSLRNPATGEISPTPGNYRFAKKWIKEALMAEGLLPKVYKNSELNETLNVKAKQAIDKFKQLEKYHL